MWLTFLFSSGTIPSSIFQALCSCLVIKSSTVCVFSCFLQPITIAIASNLKTLSLLSAWSTPIHLWRPWRKWYLCSEASLTDPPPTCNSRLFLPYLDFYRISYIITALSVHVSTLWWRMNTQTSRTMVLHFHVLHIRDSMRVTAKAQGVLLNKGMYDLF